MMYKKIMIVFLALLCFSNASVLAKDEKFYFKIYGDTNDPQQAYQTKNELIASFRQLVVGLDQSQYHQAMQDYFSKETAMNYEDHTLSVVLGDGQGKMVEGELKTDYCQADDTIETHFFFWELFHKD